MKFDLYLSKAKKRIRDLYEETGGQCYLSFSGGKDSTIVLAIIKQCEEEGFIPKDSIPAVFCNTKIEMDAIIEFVQWVKENYYGNVQIIQTPKPFGQVIREYGKPIISKLKSEEIRRYKRNKNANTFNRLMGIEYGNGVYHKIKIANKHLHVLHPDFDIKVSNECCHQMKKIPFENYAIENDIKGFFTGERMAEGGARALMMAKKLADGKNICTRIKGNYTVKSPIVDWDDEMVEEYIKAFDVPLSKAYTEYEMKRTGCFLCPFCQNLYNDLKTLKEKEPKKYKASLGFLKDVYIAQGLELDFDADYMRDFHQVFPKYEQMRYEMLKQYRPDCLIVKQYEKAQLSFDKDGYIF